jgi:hypothetical protein
VYPHGLLGHWDNEPSKYTERTIVGKGIVQIEITLDPPKITHIM